MTSRQEEGEEQETLEEVGLADGIVQPESFTDIFYALTAAHLALSHLNNQASAVAAENNSGVENSESSPGYTVEFLPEQPSSGNNAVSYGNSIQNAAFEVFIPGVESIGNYPIYASANASGAENNQHEESPLARLLASLNGMVDRANEPKAERCGHAKAAQKGNKAANLIYCAECDSVLIRNRHSDSFRALPLPTSMLKDTRFERLLAIYSQCCEIDTIAQDLLYNIERLQCCLNEWRHKYISNNKPVDFNAQNSFLYLALEQVLALQTEKIRTFADQHHIMHDRCAILMQTAASKSISPTMRQFLRNAKLQITAAHPEPIFYPTSGCLCSICGEKNVHIRLHNARQLAANRPSSRSLLINSEPNGLDCIKPNRLGKRNCPTVARDVASCESVCQCADFSICIDCLLQSYWHSTEALKKSFANCPTCRAEYHLEDIIPVYNGKPVEKAASSAET